MGIFDQIFKNKKEKEYEKTLVEVIVPSLKKIKEIKEREVREFFMTILDAAERSLRGILFMSPKELRLEKELTKEEIDFWIRKVSLALIAYSYYFFSINELMSPLEQSLTRFSYELYWQRMFNTYNKIFEENITKKDIEYYAAGLKEDIEKGYSEFGDVEKILESTARDYKTIGTELFEKIWKEDANSNEEKVFFLGVRIWQAHQQIVQPFLLELLNL